jgi:hypothetical protein
MRERDYGIPDEGGNHESLSDRPFPRKRNLGYY